MRASTRSGPSTPSTRRGPASPTWRNGRWYPTQIADPRRADADHRRASTSPATGRRPRRSSSSRRRGSQRPATTHRARHPARRPALGDYYPHMCRMPSGRVLVTGPHANDSCYLRYPGPTSTRVRLDVAEPLCAARTWGDRACWTRRRAGSTRVIQIGGSNRIPNEDDTLPRAPTARGPRRGPTSRLAARRASALNVRRAAPEHRPAAGRRDGHGRRRQGHGQARQPAARRRRRRVQLRRLRRPAQVELWNPATRQWSLGPAQVEYRTYHSTALLLPDGRVLSAGDDFNGPATTTDTAEIYSPPYLFKGARPTIAGVTAASTATARRSCARARRSRVADGRRRHRHARRSSRSARPRTPTT